MSIDQTKQTKTERPVSVKWRTFTVSHPLFDVRSTLELTWISKNELLVSSLFSFQLDAVKVEYSGGVDCAGFNAVVASFYTDRLVHYFTIDFFNFGQWRFFFSFKISANFSVFQWWKRPKTNELVQSCVFSLIRYQSVKVMTLHTVSIDILWHYKISFSMKP